MTTDGELTTYSAKGDINEPLGITSGPDGALWFTNNYGPGVGRITTDGTVTGYRPRGTAGYGITTGSDGALWVATRVGAIQRTKTTGRSKLFPLGPGIGANFIAPGSDGALWFTEGASGALNGAIGRISPSSKAITTYTTPGLGEPAQITAGPDASLWFTSPSTDLIGRITS